MKVVVGGVMALFS